MATGSVRRVRAAGSATADEGQVRDVDGEAPTFVHGLTNWSPSPSRPPEILSDGLIAAVPGVLAAFCYGRYSISKAAYEATREALVARRGHSTAGPAKSAAGVAGAVAPTPAE